MNRLSYLSCALMASALSVGAHADQTYAVEIGLYEKAPWYDIFNEYQVLYEADGVVVGYKEIPFVSTTQTGYLIEDPSKDGGSTVHYASDYVSEGIEAMLKVKPAPDKPDSNWVFLSFSYTPPTENSGPFVETVRSHTMMNWIEQNGQTKTIPFSAGDQDYRLDVTATKLDDQE